MLTFVRELRIALVIAIAMGAGGAHAQVAPSQAELQAEAARMADVYRAAVKALRNDLKDASSARFKEVYVRSLQKKDGTLDHGLCGYVNAKNSYGGYTGWKRFFATQTMLALQGDRLALDPVVMCEGTHGTTWTDSDFAVQMSRDVTAP